MTGLDHYDRELLGLDMRIHRLALACGVDLNAKDMIVSLIKGDFAVCRRGANPKRRELRGLLMLKYKIEEHCIADLGAADCLKIIEAEEENLRRRGFPALAPDR
jgi:hypothetical protein